MSSENPGRFAPYLAPENRGWLILAVGMLVLYVPVLHGLATQIWRTDEQGHGPIVLAVSAWLIWRDWNLFNRPDEAKPSKYLAWVLLFIGLTIYLLGRTQRILSLQAFSAIINLVAIAWMMRGSKLTRKLWFPLLFLLFMVPMPSTLVDSITQPMKLGVSAAATYFMHLGGLPVARTGVIIQAGPYQLLVADACAGLHTLFSLEAMGLLYLNVVRHSSALRNITLAILIVPISFIANVTRVIILTLITYYLGDEAGQGFLHGFAGMVLYLTALILIMTCDGLLRRVDEGPEQTASVDVGANSQAQQVEADGPSQAAATETSSQPEKVNG